MGKFSNVLAEELYAQSLEGFTDREYGSTTEAPGRWWALIGNAILTEDSQGFVDAEEFASAQLAGLYFDAIIAGDMEHGDYND